MLIKLTEYDNEPILLNTETIAYVRPKTTDCDIDAKSVIVLSIVESDSRNGTIYVKESFGEIMEKIKGFAQGSLF